MKIVEEIPLHETAREKYLNYALSVITSRALPDIRDGLKPVHRRILYAMYTNLRLLPDSRHRKSATVVGEVMGKYHPHGDSAIYDAMARMAQDFSLRYPLIDGQGNFGSLDGDSPAAMRYTEARLRELSLTFVEEIRKDTVHFRPNFDGSLSEPVVLPSQLPNLLLNGAAGIAVGMATNIPPHNAGEVIDALIALSANPELSVVDLLTHVKGPDFPTAGIILNTNEEIAEIYSKGEGTIHLRGEYRVGRLESGKKGVLVESIPYNVNKSDLIERIADLIRSGKLPQLIDVRDESTDDVRIALELKRGTDPEKVMTYLLKYTPLRSRFHVNLTCLLPTANPQVAVPRKVNLKEALRHFLDFRLDVITRRLAFELEQLERRIHILQGFEIIFDGLDEAIRIIRASTNKDDAAQRLMHRFRLDEIQADAILETKLYRLSKIEIDDIRGELKTKKTKAKELRSLLRDEGSREELVRTELNNLRQRFADERRTKVIGPDPERSFSQEDYIVKEDGYVIVTADGWIKRQRSYSDLESIRVRDGDRVGWALGGSTRATICVFTNFGRAYTIRIDQLPMTTGYGSPVQKIFDFSDREAVVGVICLDKRVLPRVAAEPEVEPQLFEKDDSPGDVTGPFFVAVTYKGLCARFSVSSVSEPSTKNGRLFMRLDEDDRVLGVRIGAPTANVCLASKNGRALIFPATQISVFKGVARGVIAMRLSSDDRLIGFTLSEAVRQGLEVKTSRGRIEIVRPTKFEVSNRGNKGRNVITRGTLKPVPLPPVERPLNGLNNT